MSAVARSLNAFLAASRGPRSGDAITRVVIGNEAADLDSMASSIMYAFFRSAGDGRATGSVVPVINIPREDVILRTEATYLFKRIGLDVAQLTFIDEIDLASLQESGRLALTLVDHNVLAGAQQRYAEAVEAIIDHHADAGLYPKATPRLIEPVGSAATLVADAILRERPALLDAATATLLLGTILLDTVNLSPDAKRVTAKDADVAVRLRPIAGIDPDDLFTTLEAEKFDMSALSTRDLLRKDYKEWQEGSIRYGISTVLTSLQAWMARDSDLVAGMEDYLRSRHLNCLLAMAAHSDPERGFRRDLAVLVPDETLRRRLLAWLAAGPLALSPFPAAAASANERAAFFTQGDASQSRKTFQPRLRQFLAAEGGGAQDDRPGVRR